MRRNGSYHMKGGSGTSRTVGPISRFANLGPLSIGLWRCGSINKFIPY